MPNQKINTPNSILDVKQYIFCDSNYDLIRLQVKDKSYCSFKITLIILFAAKNIYFFVIN